MRKPMGFLTIFIVFFMHSCDATNIKVEYFTSVTLECDDITLNISNTRDIQSKYWILPSGMGVDNTTTAPVYLNMKRWQISEDFSNFNITLNRVDDDEFGVYHCIVVYKNYSIAVIQQGLNIDGADFSALVEQYRHNAMVGGIAAAVLFAIIAGFCIGYNFLYANKKKNKGPIEVNGYNSQPSYDNAAAEMEEIKTVFKEGQNNLYPNPNEINSERL